MIAQIDAIYDHGVLKPLEPLPLPDQARVRLIVDRQVSGDASHVDSSRGDARRQTEVAAGIGTDFAFDTQLEALLFDGPTLPPDFSRADIYADHD